MHEIETLVVKVLARAELVFLEVGIIVPFIGVGEAVELGVEIDDSSELSLEKSNPVPCYGCGHFGLSELFVISQSSRHGLDQLALFVHELLE